MRWEQLLTDARGVGAATMGERQSTPLPFALPAATVRTFDTPEFQGMTFYEVRAKSILNRVPAGSRMSFSWTINPYRGCSHACTYCLVGDTPILMADGSTRPLADLTVGDRIYGTVREGAYRRYVFTEVLAHWQTLKQAYRIRLADGTVLTASGDHRFLTERGWKHVTAGRFGIRPHLTPGERLVGLPVGARLATIGAPTHRSAPQRAAGGGDHLRIVGIEALGLDLPMYDITTGTGDFIANGVISHNCFARNTHTYLDMDAGQDFDTRIVVKVNAGELLRAELARPKWAGEHVAMGTNVDCYQRAEGRYRLMRDILAALRDAANPFSILTKGTLILRDLDLLTQAREVTSVDLAMSVGFVDEALWRSVEPGTPSPRRRLDAVRRLTDAGLRVGVLMAPVLPGITDTAEHIEATVAAIAAAGAGSITPIALHLRPGAREWYLRWLAANRPDLLGLYRERYGDRSYLSRTYQRELTARVRLAAARHGIHRDGSQPEGRREISERPPGDSYTQLALL